VNFIEAYKQGQAGKNKGLSTGISTLDEAIDGIQRKSIYTIGAAPKV
jgi:replicative DNA helicase